ncbi:MAG: hypothetical protein HQL38_05945 [Alphaproteobacteria bacterium]|nr:hypothetical protein [Alphaproteobacteria bacterium]MBF0372867.1 hypothetical protein [Alphaproteobacteria bacterium]MBF0392205.1 hypothetical protein [Alphaproteobacteria bacterium]
MSEARPTSRRGATPFHVVAAGITARLNAILPVAQDITLEAVNAKALIVRTGDAVRAFRPITDYMDELAQDTIRLVRAINQEATLVLRATMEEMRLGVLVRALRRALDAYDGPNAVTVGARLAQIEDRRQKLETERRSRRHALDMLITEIDARMKAARIIAGTSRIEAAGAGPYQGSVGSVADTLERAAKAIQARIDECRRMLRRADY